MSFNFIKNYLVTIEYPEITEFNDFAFPRVRQNTIIASFSDYQIVGSFKYTGVGTSASADNNSLTIVNASDEIERATRDLGVKVTIRAGYLNDNDTQVVDPKDHPILYKGEVTKADTTRNSTEKLTKLILSSALTNKKNARVNLTFPKGTSVRKVLKDIADTLKLKVVIDSTLTTGGTITKDKSFNGNTTQVLEKFCTEQGFKWFIQDEEVFIVPKDSLKEASNTAQVYKISAGRIKGEVNWSVDNTASTSSSEQKIKADFTTFLLSGIKVGDSVQIPIKGQEQTLIVDSVGHKLDYYGNTWDTTITATSESN